MKASINKDGCTSCGLCPHTCPEVFRMSDAGIAEVYTDKVPIELEDVAKVAGNLCPASVITVEY